MKNFLAYFATFFSATKGFILASYLTKYAGIEAYGVFSILIATAGILSSLFALRGGESVTRFFTRETENKNFKVANGFLLIHIFLDLIISVIMILILFGLAGFVNQYFFENDNFYIEYQLIIISTVLIYLRGSSIGFLQSRQKFNLINLIKIADVTLLTLLLAMLLWLKHEITLTYFIKVFLFNSLAITVSFYLATLINFVQMEVKSISFNMDYFKELINFNVITFFSGTLKSINSNLDTIILGSFLTTSDVGIYNLLKKIIHPIMLIAQPLILLNYPYMVKLHTQKKYLRIISLIKKKSVFIILISAVYFVSVLILRDSIDDFFNIKLDQFFLILTLIFASTFLQLLVWWGRSISNIFNPKISLFANFLSIFYGIAITYFATKYFGFIGMALAVFFWNLFVIFYFTYFLLRYCRVEEYE